MRHDNNVSAGVEPFVTAGVDIGTRTVKVSLLAHGPAPAVVLAREVVAVGERRTARDAQIAVKEGWDRALRSAGLMALDVVFIASTGADAYALARVGHVYRRLSLMTGARFLSPGATAVLDVGLSRLRCARLDGPMPGPGYAAISMNATGGTANHEDLARRASILMRGLAVDGPTALTGATALDLGFVRALGRWFTDRCLDVTLLVSPDAMFAESYGAALLAAERFQRVLESHLRRGALAEPRPRLCMPRLSLN